MNKKGRDMVSDIEGIIKDLEKERPRHEYESWVVEDGVLMKFKNSRKFREMMIDLTKEK